MDHHHSNSNLAMGLVLGALAGVAIALLLAPKPGSETRRLLKDVVAKGVDRLQGLQAGQELQVK